MFRLNLTRRGSFALRLATEALAELELGRAHYECGQQIEHVVGAGVLLIGGVDLLVDELVGLGGYFAADER